MMRPVLPLAVGALLSAAARPQETPADASPGVRARLVEVMLAGLDRGEPSANVVRRTAGESLFDGSYDWHSNLFAHWVLLTHARTEGDADLAARLLAPLTSEALAEEAERLRQVETGRLATFPYDQSWFLLMLAELGEHRELDAGARELRVELEERILAWLEEEKFPENDNPDVLDGRGIVGWYRSWAFTWYQLRRSQPVGADTLERLARLREVKLEPQLSAMLAPVEPFPFEFLWVPAIAWLIHDVEPFDEPLPRYELGEMPPLPESVKLSTTHLLGVHLSRLWPLAIAARDDEGARARLDAELATFLEREDLWAGDFQVVSHWVPQMIWFTIWLAEERL